LLFQFSVLLLVIFTLEVGTGIAGYIRRNEVETMLENKLNSTMFDYYNNEKIKETWDIAQHEVFISYYLYGLSLMFNVVETLCRSMLNYLT
jgi:hypothetical protein